MPEWKFMVCVLDRVKVERFRHQRKLTAARAADASGMHGREEWNAIVAARQPSISLLTLRNMSRALGCRPSDLLIQNRAKTGPLMALPIGVVDNPREQAEAKQRRIRRSRSVRAR
jgi:DNA-binding Xre family transcriptional regulator